MKRIVLVVFLSLCSAGSVFAQFGDHFGYIDETAIQQFGKPLVTSLGVAMNSGAFHTAKVPKLFGFSIGMRAMLMSVPDDQLTFAPTLPAGYVSVTGENKTATIFGNEGGIYAGPGGFYTFPNGINETSIPFALPQATVSLMGTELLVRFAPINIKETKVTLFGVGLKHSVSQYIPFCPVDLAVQVLYNKLDIQDLLTSTHIAFNAELSTSFAIATIYGGVQYESSKLNFDYTVKADPANANPLLQASKKVSAEVAGDNAARVTVGGTLTMGFFLLNADYSIGSQSVASAGITFEF